jgi:hypothetical protein
MANDRERAPEKRRAPGAKGSSGYTQDTVVLNDFSGVTFEQRTRTSAAGKTGVRYSLSMEAEPILNILDGVYLGKGPADAIRDILIKQSKSIGQFIKPSTELHRKRMRREFAEGGAKPTGPLARRFFDVARRYSGGTTGAKAPGAGGTNRIGVDSGRLSEGWFVRQNPVEQSFTINVPENRFTPETWAGTMESLQAWVTRFVSLVPALADPKSILGDDAFVRAVAKSPPVVLLGKAGGEWKDYARATFAGLRKVYRAAF